MLDTALTARAHFMLGTESHDKVSERTSESGKCHEEKKWREGDGEDKAGKGRPHGRASRWRYEVRVPGQG